MPMVGRVKEIKKREGSNLAYGIVVDIDRNWEFPFEAPSGMFNVGDKVSFEPEEDDPVFAKLVMGKKKVILLKKL